MSISVFLLDPDGACKVVWTSGSKRAWKLHLNIEQDHFSLIIHIATYAKTFTCKTCSRVFTRKHGAITHTCLAGDATPFRFAGEPFVHNKTIFDKLEDMGLLQKRSVTILTGSHMTLKHTWTLKGSQKIHHNVLMRLCTV